MRFGPAHLENAIIALEGHASRFFDHAEKSGGGLGGIQSANEDGAVGGDVGGESDPVGGGGQVGGGLHIIRGAVGQAARGELKVAAAQDGRAKGDLGERRRKEVDEVAAVGGAPAGAKVVTGPGVKQGGADAVGV